MGWHKNRSRAKLTWLQVADIRRWVRSDGFGLSVAEQVRALAQLPPYAELGANTLKDVIQNHTWYDPDYQPLEKMDGDEDSTLTRFLVWVMLWTWLSRFRGAVASSPGVLPGAVYEEVA